MLVSGQVKGLTGLQAIRKGLQLAPLLSVICAKMLAEGMGMVLCDNIDALLHKPTKSLSPGQAAQLSGQSAGKGLGALGASAFTV